MCPHLICTPCHMRLKKEAKYCCPFCAFNMSDWQQSHLHHEDLYNDMEGYDTDEEGYADFGFWLPEDQWKKYLKKATRSGSCAQ